MQIKHLAVWTKDLEALKKFYIQYFDVRAGGKYVNPKRGFESYFLQFESGARIEIMSFPHLNQAKSDHDNPGVLILPFASAPKRWLMN
jgi:lactoylglutathione lyase